MSDATPTPTSVFVPLSVANAVAEGRSVTANLPSDLVTRFGLDREGRTFWCHSRDAGRFEAHFARVTFAGREWAKDGVAYRQVHGEITKTQDLGSFAPGAAREAMVAKLNDLPGVAADRVVR